VSHSPVEALLDEAIDVAFLTTSPVHGALDEVPLFSDEIVFVVGKDHPLAERPSLSPADLREHPLITSTRTPAAESRWFFTQVFGRTKPKLTQLQFPLTEAIIDAARAGMGIAILSEWIAGPYLGEGDLVMKRLRKRALKRPWRMAFRREVEAPAKRLAAALEGTPPRVYT
jgi:LysR family transcriptional regulator, regulator for metE and metH